mgnify:CR=1 FL=1
MLAAFGCAKGSGEGQVSGTVWAPDCGLEGDLFELNPNFFAMQPSFSVEVIDIVVQRGSDQRTFSDYLSVVIREPEELRESMLGTEIELGGFEAPVEMTLSLNATCPGIARLPVAYAAVSGTIRFERLFVPWLDDNDPSCGPDRICSETGCSEDPDCASCGADGICVICAEEDPDCPSKATGDPCQQNEECSGGTCVTWDGDFASRFCSETCLQDDDCPDDMGCRNFSNERLCYWEDDPPGRLGSKCDAAEDCYSNVCDESQCVVTCNLALGLDCPADFTCTDNGAGDYFCRADDTGDSGGCNSSGNGDTGIALLLLGAFALLARRRLA